MPVNVILDSNFLLIPARFKVDIYEALSTVMNKKYDPIILSTNLEELARMANSRSPKRSRDAKLALTLAERCKMSNADRKVGESNDDVIVRVAAEMRCPVATNDRALRKRLRSINVPVIYLRQKSRLEMDGALY